MYIIYYCTVFIVSTGYIITFNATEYEFDVNVYSPVGTVVFEALLIVENINGFDSLGVNFVGNLVDYGPYSINGLDVDHESLIQTNPLLTISLDETLDVNDDKVDYNFAIQYVAVTSTIYNDLVNIILHEIGKQLHTCCFASYA